VQTQLPESLLDSPQGREADAILRRCVHCGFCNATCPTYQLLGEELDGPRGRIYLIKQLLEGEGDADTVRTHLDRCLTCRSCETTCPSGVKYSRLLDIGREQAERQGTRPWQQRVMRWGLRQLLPFPRRFALLLGLARVLRPLLPQSWATALPAVNKASVAGANIAVRHPRRVILLDGCVQSVAAPEINCAAARVLDHLGISVQRVTDGGCCGAVEQHLSAPQVAAQRMRRNIDAWWPLTEAGAEAIVSTASACGLQVKDYGHLLRDDPLYADKAQRISAQVKDIAELVADSPAPSSAGPRPRVAFHSPCTLQHGQRLGGVVEQILRDWGFELTPVADGHLCCGSAGAYSLLQPVLSDRLRADKLVALRRGSPQVIASANIGCLMHLRQGAESSLPVRHWVELLADCLPNK